MNILFFNRSFYPDLEATGQFLTELCEDLSKYGHDVTVVAGRSYHVSDKKKTFLVSRDRYKSISVLRVSGTNFPKRILLFRLVNLGFYFLFAFVAGFYVKNKPNIVVAQTDPPVMGLLGCFFSKWYKAKFIYSCKDIYPEIGIITGKLKNPLLNYFLDKINKFSFRNADKIICLGEDMKKRIEDKGVASGRIDIVHDWADTEKLYAIDKNENPFTLNNELSDSFNVIYSGNIGLTQGLEKVVELADRFKDNKKLKFIFIGEGASKNHLKKEVDNKGLTNVIFIPYQPMEKLVYSLNAADLHLITLQKGLSGLIVPSKVYGILACGKPFMACVDKDCEINNIALRFKCGLISEPGNLEEMAKKIEWAINNKEELKAMGKRGREAALHLFKREISTSKFNNIIQELMK